METRGDFSVRLRRTAAPLLAAAATALVFWPSVRCAFVNADDPEFLNRPYQGLSAAAVRGSFTHFYFSNYAPLSLLSLNADAAAWGRNPFGYHLTNLLLHAANAALFSLLLLEFLPSRGAAREDRWAAVGAALFFSLHPLRVESVTWVSERRDVLCGFFFLLTMLFWMRSRRPGRLSGGRGRAAALGAFALALLSKAAAVPLPFVLVLLDVWPFKRLPPSPRDWTRTGAVWREKLPFFALAAIFSALAAAAQRGGGALRTFGDAPALQRVEQALLNLVYYQGKLLWPANLTFYDWHWPPVRAAAILGTFATALLLAAAVRSRRLRAPLLAALGYQTLLLAPVLGLVTIGHEIAADRYSYLSGLAWAGLFGALLREGLRRRRTATAAAAVVLLAAFAAATRAQIGVWKDSASLWKHMLKIDPMSPDARPWLAGALIAEGRTGEAILYLEEHLRLYPDDAEARRALDAEIAATGTTPRDHAGFHEQLGLEFAARGEFGKAAWHFERGLRDAPDSESLRRELDEARRRAGITAPGDGAR